jgi:hypothetical protein
MAGFEFEDRLRLALREAAERQSQAGPWGWAAATGRTAIDATRRSFVPAASAVVATLIALAIATVLLTRSGSQGESVEPPEVVARLALADSLGHTVGAFSSVWVADTGDARLLRIDPESRRVTARVAVQSGVVMAPSGEMLWALNQDLARDVLSFRGRLLRIDPRSDEVAERLALRTPSGEAFSGIDLAAGEDSVWMLGTTRRWHNSDSVGLIRLDARTGRVTVGSALPGGWGRVGIALRRDGLWAVTADNRLLRFDARTGEKLSESRLGLGPVDRNAEPSNGQLQFAGNTLVASTRGGLAGIDPYAGRVVWRRPLGQRVLAWTEADGLVWAAVSPQGPDRLFAVDPEDGRVATSVGLGSFGAAGIASVGDAFWITTAGGEAVVMRR